MTDTDLRPRGWHTVTPRVVANDAKRLVDFMVSVFDADAELHDDRPAIVHLGDSIVMVSETGARPAMPAFLYVYVRDADDVFRRAIAAGAHAIEKPFQTPYGDRRCMIEDKWGNVWQ